MITIGWKSASRRWLKRSMRRLSWTNGYWVRCLRPRESCSVADVLDALRERGFVQDVSDEPGLKEAFASGPVTFYWGTDPTASSLTAGHLVSLMLLAHLQRAGHRPIVVIGGGTGL